MESLKNRNFNPDTVPGEYNVVALWTRFRGERIKAGLFAGIFAGAMMQVFGMIYAASQGMDITTPMRISALPILGNEALAYASGSGIAVGLFMFFLLCSVLGTTYAHFTGTNHKWNRLGMGLTWGAYSWIFITCLFSPAFRAYEEAAISRGVMFFAWMVFGISLMSVAWFDKKGPQK
ncbi:MAG: hypothetical protein KGP28_01365 [Bdellovibrionales bacterium]|nr:hypothetical protein [Bdellovibrionales bacterium]